METAARYAITPNDDEITKVLESVLNGPPEEYDRNGNRQSYEEGVEAAVLWLTGLSDSPPKF